MQHSPSQEKTWATLQKNLGDRLANEYQISSSTPHVLEVSRTLKPVRRAILNYAGTDVFFHREEGDQLKSAAEIIRVNQDGTLLELRTGPVVTESEIESAIRTYLAARSLFERYNSAHGREGDHFFRSRVARRRLRSASSRSRHIYPGREYGRVARNGAGCGTVPFLRRVCTCCDSPSHGER